MRGPWLWATLLVAAGCSFSSPEIGEPGDTPDGAGGGGGPDGTPPCADDDGDTVCNTLDKCAASDDRLDIDADGSPDGCDDWPCGLKPGDPGDPMSDSEDGRSWSAAFISIGNSRRVVAAPGQPFNVDFRWLILVNCGEQNSCRAQLEYGYGSNRVGCLFDDDVNDGQPTAAQYDDPLVAPATAGIYELRLNAGRRSSCGTGQSWFDETPGSDSTIAILCVR